MSDTLPVYTDPQAAARSVHGEIVAPPTMLNAWTMTGLAPRGATGTERAGALGIYDALDAAGFTSVVATNSEHEYHRYLRLGDHLSGRTRLQSVSGEKQRGERPATSDPPRDP